MNIARDQNQFDEVEDLASRGGLLYRQSGSPESAAQLLVRAAKILEMKAWVTILMYSIAPPHWNLCELWPKNWQDKEKFHIFWPFFMNLTQFYPFFLKFDMILAYFSNITLKI